MPEPGEAFVDVLHGRVAASAADDFVVRRTDGLFAYQLAVVVDDTAMGISEVVRGDDLLSSTTRQIALYRALGAEPPAFVHVPLVLGADGERLAKRHGAIALADYRAAGQCPEQVVGRLAASLGPCPPGRALRPADLLAEFELGKVDRVPFRLQAFPPKPASAVH
jgi:glutamyl-tRNA synthetase